MFHVHEEFPHHPKVEALEDLCRSEMEFAAALGVWLACGCDSRLRLTDGFVSTKRLRKLVGKASKMASQLCESGLWEKTEGGYLFHDWADIQEIKAQVRARREKDRARKQKGKPGPSGGNPRGTVAPESGGSDAESRAPTLPIPTQPIPKGDARDLCRKWAADTSLPLEALSSSHVQPAKAICSAAQAAGVAWADVYARWVADPWVQAQAPGLTHLENNLHKYIKPTGEADPYANLPRYA